MSNNPYAPPLATVEDVPLATAIQPPFFAVSITKLVVMYLATFGFYSIAWFFQHWRRIKAREQSRISPGPRSVFSLFYCYPCFRRIRNYEVASLGDSKLAAGPLTIGWIVSSVFYQLPFPWLLIGWCSFLFIVPVQIRANRINAAVSPGHDPNSRFTVLNWVFIVLGSLFVLMALAASFLSVPPQ
jgi:hypothetical protein